MKLEFTYQEAKELLEYFGDDKDPDTTMTVQLLGKDDGLPSDSQPGLYVSLTEYPEEGIHLLGPIKDER